MQTFTNEENVALSVAVYLATDHYDYVPDAISATSLMKPLRQQILPGRIPQNSPYKATDVLRVVKSRIGTAIHDGVEKAWIGGHYKTAMKALGYSADLIKRVIVNPNPDCKLKPNAIPVYLERRSFREIDGIRVSGKFDFVAEGRVEDFKSTSTFTWIHDTNSENYKIQGSIYRWLNEDIITQDVMAIQFLFTDWMPGKAKQDPKYPQHNVETLIIPLMTITETKQYIRGQLAMFAQYKNAAEKDIPFCTDKQLWRKEPMWKYYKNPAKRLRSTKNFDFTDYKDPEGEANARAAKDGNVGVVVRKSGEVVACKYCPAFSECTQKDIYIADGSLILT